MSDFLSLNAEMREVTGRSASRRLRRAGRLPAIIYGGGKSDLPITLNMNEASKSLNVEQFHTSILTIIVAGSKDEEKVLLKDAQWNPVRDTISHLDFFRVKGSDVIEIEIPIVAINAEKAPGVIEGGQIEVVRHALEVSCRADAIPENIVVDCAALQMGDTIHVEDLTLPEGVEAPHEVNFTILNLAVVKGGADQDDDTEEDAAAPEA
ncbi:MAG: 50S ribosomal protein L25/general stress protein Ctc [Mariprofundaceae bacterium]|nr:50S ribosomal protein L25/general stress protein Ctc [Mariprofundaceae bacterium]